MKLNIIWKIWIIYYLKETAIDNEKGFFKFEGYEIIGNR